MPFSLLAEIAREMASATAFLTESQEGFRWKTNAGPTLFRSLPLAKVVPPTNLLLDYA
jgi:hypothetical protein